MDKISEAYVDEHSAALIKCPKCESDDVIAAQDDKGYFWVKKCNKCGYLKKNNKPESQ